METTIRPPALDLVAPRRRPSGQTGDFNAPVNVPAGARRVVGTGPGLLNVAIEPGVPARHLATTLGRPLGGRDVSRFTSGTTPHATGGIMKRPFWRHTVPAALVALAGTAFAPATAQAQSAAAATPTVTLGEARRRASTTDPSAVAARGQIETALWERRAAFTDLFTPTLTGESNYTRFSDPFFNIGTGGISS
ncbi:MAG TPA: hypothetical protein VHL59_17440, partial [Thermoanaerobaculia bacterium]|nr:hypothetical protein [Thermoanaerobaculia bacterium]